MTLSIQSNWQSQEYYIGDTILKIFLYIDFKYIIFIKPLSVRGLARPPWEDAEGYDEGGDKEVCEASQG